MASYRADDSFFTRRMGYPEAMTYPERDAYNQKEREREFKRQRQEIVAERLSDLTAEEYGEDVLDAMIDTEVSSGPDLTSTGILTPHSARQSPTLNRLTCRLKSSGTCDLTSLTS